MLVVPQCACSDILSLSRVIRLRPVAYVGSDILRYREAALVMQDLRTGCLPSATGTLLRQILSPSKDMGSSIGCQYDLPTELSTSAVPANQCQQDVVLGLRGGLEAIQGPPGTGKSTTIFHIINSKVGPEKKVLITATRNQAINAVVEKLSCLQGGILVFGNKQRLCYEAQRHTLLERVARHPETLFWNRVKGKLQQMMQMTYEAISDGYANFTGSRTRPARAMSPHLETWRSHALAMVRDGLRRRAEVRLNGVLKPNPMFFLSQTLTKFLESLEQMRTSILPSVNMAVSKEILCSTRAFLSTIDACARMASDLEKAEFILEVDTVIVDEGACVPEYAIPQLLALHPRNLVLLGDHKQLPCFSAIDDQDLPCHSRSLMQRMVDCGVKVPMLTEQFRMASKICKVVSKVFYQGKLTTAPKVMAVPNKMGCKALQWMESKGIEEKHQRGGYFNKAEAEQAVEAGLSIYDKLKTLQRINKPSVYLMSPYNQQKYQMEKKLKEYLSLRPDIAENALQVLSVDAVQGSEADATVLSLVKTQSELSTFFVDVRRACVALSRAKHVSIIIGSSSVFCAKKNKQAVWQRVAAMYQ